jgi:6-phosphogluconolactonase (cycloisomerase 2 family)
LTVNGANFGGASVVQVNGSSRPTTFVNAGQLSAQIGGGDLAAAGKLSVAVFTPAPGGGTSNSLTFTVLPLSRFAYFTAPSGAIFTAEVNAATGQLRYAGYGFDAVAATAVPFSVTLDPTGQFLYEASSAGANNPGFVSMFKVNAGNGVLTTIAAPVATGNGPEAVAVHPSGKFVYVANSFSNNISMYDIVAGGSLTPIGGVTVGAGTGPQSIAMDPAGKFAYVANSGSGDVSMYTIDSAGGLHPNTSGGGSGTISVGGTPGTVAVDPSGRFAYVAVGGSGANVLTFSIGPAGTLSQVGSAVSSGTNPQALAIDPLGHFLYVASSGDISTFSIKSGSGALTLLGNVTIASGLSPVTIAVDPSDEFVYVGSFNETGESTISWFEIQNGFLFQTGTMPTAGPASLVLSHGNTPVTHTPRFAYVANFSDNTVSMYQIDPGNGALTPVVTGAGTGTVPTGISPCGVAVDPTGRFAYVASFSDNSISMYSIDPSNGALTLVGALVVPGTNPCGVAVDPTGRFAYSANSNNTVSFFTINTNGALTLRSQMKSGLGPNSVTIDPSGHFLYTANFQSSNVSMYSIDPGTGALTSLGADKAASAGVFEVAIDPTASFAYVSNSDTRANNLFAYHISASGSLTFVEKVDAGTEPDGLAVDPSGEFVYVANTGSTNVSMYSVGPFGILTSLTPPTVPTGRDPSRVAVDPSGRFVYVTNTSPPSVSIYTINGDGTLTPLAKGNATTGAAPGAIAITGTTQ